MIAVGMQYEAGIYNYTISKVSPLIGQNNTIYGNEFPE